VCVACVCCLQLLCFMLLEVGVEVGTGSGDVQHVLCIMPFLLCSMPVLLCITPFALCTMPALC
jgi:hypothetical protein